MNNPKISVIIPAYNSAQYITETIDSVLNQTLQDFEIVVIDDGSIDKTKEVVGEYIKRYPDKIRYSYQKNNGVASARNRAIGASRGEFLSFVDDDDLLLPEMLERHLEKINEGYDWVFPDKYFRKILSSSLAQAPIICGPKIPHLPEKKEELYKILLKNFVGSIRGLVRKSVFARIGYFNERICACEDYELWLRFAKEGLRATMIEGPLYTWGSRENSYTIKDSSRGLKSWYYLRKQWMFEAFKMDPSYRNFYAQVFWNLGRRAYNLKEYFLAFKCLILSQYCVISWQRFFGSFISVVKR